MTSYIADTSPLAIATINAIQSGEINILKGLLLEHANLPLVRILDAKKQSRTLLHIATDWPGHFPNCAESISLLIKAGADVDAQFEGGTHTETPLHWAASSNDINALNVLIVCGADIEATGGVIGGGTPLSDATAYGQWEAAYRLVELGANPTLFDMAALELMDRLKKTLATKLLSENEINDIFWGACHGGRYKAALLLLGYNANINWIPSWENLTPLDAAQRSNAIELVQWLRLNGAKSYKDLIGLQQMFM